MIESNFPYTNITLSENKVLEKIETETFSTYQVFYGSLNFLDKTYILYCFNEDHYIYIYYPNIKLDYSFSKNLVIFIDFRLVRHNIQFYEKNKIAKFIKKNSEKSKDYYWDSN